MRRREQVLGVPIDVLDWTEALVRLSTWAEARESRSVCLCNAHSVITASRDPAFRKIISAADLAAPDGMPVAWMLRRLGHFRQERINGPDLMWRYCARAASRGEKIFLFGSDDETIGNLEKKLLAFPGLIVAGACAPPFRAMTDEEDRHVVERINTSGASIVWVGLGCPKQEQWMHAHRGRIHAVMIGVGAAFDYHAGTLRRAPSWMQTIGLEWLYRLACEPRRLWRRYLITNTLFILGAFRQLARSNRNPRQ
jgi:N-acetylglucosaminyldiphosphoundecaprenol N-acetyl-beta-D-mannosaminyltransferase